MLQPRFRAALLDANFEVADPRAAKPEEVVRRPLADLKGTPFLREDPGEFHRRSKLPGLIGIRHDCGNVDHRFHRLASEVHWSGMRFAKGCVSFFGREPQYQVRFQNAATHVAVDHKRESSEHLPFREFAGALENQPYAVGEMDIVCHDYLA